MAKMTLKEIEMWVDNVEPLYWWAADYCKQNRCSVRKFIKDNYDEVIEVIRQNGGKA